MWLSDGSRDHQHGCRFDLSRALKSNYLCPIKAVPATFLPGRICDPIALLWAKTAQVQKNNVFVDLVCRSRSKKIRTRLEAKLVGWLTGKASNAVK
jgi:hypothetical protein